jgi:NitT/TauT family transport system substrate-binding protein
MKKAAVVLTALALLAAPPGGAAAEKLRLGYVRGDLHHLAAHIAAGKGFFGEEGLEVEVAEPFESGAAVAAALGAKSIDVGYLNLAPGLTALAERTADLRAAALANTNGMAIVVRADAEAAVVANLAGMTIAIPGAPSIEDLLLRRAVEAAGVAPESIQTHKVKPADMVAALAARDVDGFVAAEPVAAQAVAKGAGRILLRSSEIWAEHPCCVVAFEGSVAKDRPDAFKAFLRAHQRAMALISADPEEAVRTAVTVSGLDEATARAALGNIGFRAEIEMPAVRAYAAYLEETWQIKQGKAETLPKEFVDPAGLWRDEAP